MLILPERVPCRDLLFSTDGEVACRAATDDVLQLWDTKTWTPHHLDFSPEEHYFGLAAAPGRLIVELTGNTTKKSFRTVRLNSKNGSATLLATNVEQSVPLTPCREAPSARDLLRGWDSSLAAVRHTTETVTSCDDSGWVIRSLCRVSNEGDCDVEFVPTAIPLLTKLLEPIYWRATRNDLEQVSGPLFALAEPHRALEGR